MTARFGLRRLRWLALILVVLPVLILAGGLVWWARSLPALNGSVALSGLSGEARAIRDSYGVPHIFAANMTDAMRVLGYLHAQDRLFQMDITRRVSQGRLAAIIGPDGLRYDRLFRTLDLAGRARDSLAAFSPEAKAQLQAYADGVNARLIETSQALPIEYTVLGFAPEPWKPEDSVLWGKAMAWKLSANWRQDALRAKLVSRYDPGRVERLFPKPFPEWPVTIAPRIEAAASRAEADTPQRRLDAVKASALDYAALLAIPTAGHGASNEWVVDGSRSTTGKPLLANDPHLELGVPILWYLARITTPELTLTGATAPSAPMVLLGQNGHIAWGFTTTESDTQDLFVETPDPAKTGHYLTPDGSRPLIEERITIEVKDAPPTELIRRSTHRGPIISDAPEIVGGNGKALISLAWTGFSSADTTAEAFFRINTARNWDEFSSALRLYQSPAQNIVFASREGSIGFINAGAVPVRKSGDGRYPAAGATGEADWSGLVPFEGWPRLLNPPQGAIVNANNMVAPLDYPHWLGYDQGPGFRARRIVELLGKRDSHDLNSFAAMQMDAKANHARDLVPYLLKLTPDSALAAQVLELIRNWDYEALHGRPEPLILEWWLGRMNLHLLKAGFDAPAPAAGALLDAAEVIDIMRRPDGFCQGEAGDDCMGAVKAAFADTLRDLSSRHGPDASRWRWGDEHTALMANTVLDRVPGFQPFFRRDFPSDGGFYAVNRGGGVGASSASKPLARNSGAGFRGIYDLADPARSRFIIATGQSEHPLSHHYTDQLPLWQRGEHIRLHVSEAELAANNRGTLTFRPKE